MSPKVDRIEVLRTSNYAPCSTRFGAGFKARRMGTSCIVLSDFAVLWATGARTEISPRMALELVAAFVPPADHPARSFAGEECFADPTTAAVELPLATPTAESVSGVGGGESKLCGASGVAANVADLWWGL